MPLRLIHIVNPYTHDGRLDAHQQITLNSITDAKKNYTGEVILVAVSSGQSAQFLPSEFVIATGNVRALSGISDLQYDLPLLSDVLSVGATAAGGDYIIYSNMDIIVRPDFYSLVEDFLKTEKADAMIINRRQVDEELASHPQSIFSLKGDPHPGYDCFVFPYDAVGRLQLGNIVIGAPGIGFMMAHNLFLMYSNVKVIWERAWTYHLGKEIVSAWKGKAVAEWQKNEILGFIRRNKSKFRISSFPGYNFPFWRRHFKWLMNPLFNYPLMFNLDIRSLFDGRTIRNIAEKRSWKEEYRKRWFNFEE